jgi:hypothetical protein
MARLRAAQASVRWAGASEALSSSAAVAGMTAALELA